MKFKCKYWLQDLSAKSFTEKKKFLQIPSFTVIDFTVLITSISKIIFKSDIKLKLHTNILFNNTVQYYSS